MEYPRIKILTVAVTVYWTDEKREIETFECYRTSRQQRAIIIL